MASNRRRQCKKKNSQTNRAKKHMKPWGRGGECTFNHSERFCALWCCCSWLRQRATVPRPRLSCRCLHHLHHLFHSPAVLHSSVSKAPLCYTGSWWSHITQTQGEDELSYAMLWVRSGTESLLTQKSNAAFIPPPPLFGWWPAEGLISLTQGGRCPQAERNECHSLSQLSHF